MAIEAKRRQQLLLAGLLVVLAIVGYRALSGPSAVSLPSSNGQGPAATRRATAAAASAPDVHLGALDAERPSPVSNHRDLFRFKPKAPPPSAAAPAPGPVASAPAAPAPPPGPPPPPPIPYKFVGLVEGQAKRIAVLSDGRNAPVYGREGDIIEGRFKIVKIGVESIEMEYIDGRGKQTIRLSGS